MFFRNNYFKNKPNFRPPSAMNHEPSNPARMLPTRTLYRRRIWTAAANAERHRFSERLSTNPFIPSLKINQNMRSNPESSVSSSTLAGLPVRHNLAAANVSSRGRTSVPICVISGQNVFFLREANPICNRS